MNESENLSAPNKTVEDLRQQLTALRKMFATALLVLIVLSASVNLYLLRQVITVRKELERERVIVDQYSKAEGPAIQSFLVSLQTFAQTHPDLMPLLAKYNLATSANAPATPQK